MTRIALRPPIEILVEWIAAGAIGCAVTFAAAQLAPLAIAVVVGLAAALGGLWLLARIDQPGAATVDTFEPVEFVASDLSEKDVLLLDDPVPSNGTSRVVQLFGGAPNAGAVRSEGAAPGEMIDAIEEFLERGAAGARFSRTAAIDGAGASLPPGEDASAALHAALADIRRSLRQA